MGLKKLYVSRTHMGHKGIPGLPEAHWNTMLTAGDEILVDEALAKGLIDFRGKDYYSAQKVERDVEAPTNVLAKPEK